MKFGTHYLIGINSFDYDPVKTIDNAARLGFDSLEIPFFDLMDGGEDKGLKIAEYAYKKGIQLVFVGGFPEDCDMLSEDEQIRKNGIKYMHRLFPLMKKMNVDLLVGCHYTKWPTRREEPLSLDLKKKLFDRTVREYKIATEPAGDYGVTCAIETLNRYEAFLLNCSEETAAFIDAVGNPYVKMHFDTFHMSIEENSITGALETAGHRLAALHLGERNRRFPGTGDLCWDDFFATLKKINYDGYMDLEAFILPEGTSSAVLGVWRDLSYGASKEEYDILHANALIFMKEKSRQYGLI